MAAKGAEAFGEDPQKGLTALQQARSLCPGSWAVAYNLGLALYLAGQPARAYEQWEKLAGQGPCPRLAANLGWLALELGRPEDAVRWAGIRNEMGRPDANSAVLTLEALLVAGQLAEALDFAFTDVRYLPRGARQKAVRGATEAAWGLFRSGRRVLATDRITELADKFPDVRELESARDIMVAALLDESVKIPEPAVKEKTTTGGGEWRNTDI